jgi:alpha-tubulin suppressor-like RCC1 family protein
MAIQSNGTLWAWGNNSPGQLGNTSLSTNFLTPIQIGTTSTWVGVSCGYYSSVAIQNNGTLWAWGNNSYGQLGTSDQINYSTPIQVGSLNKWNFVNAGGYSTVALQIP